MAQALLEPGQTALSVTCALTPFGTAVESLLPPFVASAGKATVPDDITDKGACVWQLNSSTLTLTATLSVPLVRAPSPARCWLRSCVWLPRQAPIEAAAHKRSLWAGGGLKSTSMRLCRTSLDLLAYRGSKRRWLVRCRVRLGSSGV